MELTSRLEVSLNHPSHHRKSESNDFTLDDSLDFERGNANRSESITIHQRNSILELDSLSGFIEVRKEMKGMKGKEAKKSKKQVPDLPFHSEPKNLNPEQILDFLEGYLRAMITLEYVCKTNAFWQFIELSDYNHEGIVKVKETFIKKKSGGHFQKRNCFQSCFNPFSPWKKRYIVITSEGIMYSIGNRKPASKIREMLLFDHNFAMEFGKQATQREFGIVLITTTRKLYIEAFDLFHFVDIIAAIKDAMRLSPYVDLHRYDSFAPIRFKSNCQWFVDGEGYFSQLYDRLISAISEVFITDWWLSPEMYLKRPISSEKSSQDSRFDRVLQKIASRGVKIYIIVYREPTIALNLNSNYTKQTLSALHENIFVLRHPSTLIPLLWSHHEKMVIIDQTYGFLGGLDICYGRWDTQAHNLTDQYPNTDSSAMLEKTNGAVYFPGIDYSNARIKDFRDVKEINTSDINRDTQPRMPWHDIAMLVVGEPVRDMARHFIQYWNFAKVDIYSKDTNLRLDSLVPGLEAEHKHKLTKVVSNYWHRILSKFKKVIHKNDSVELQSSPTRIAVAPVTNESNNITSSGSKMLALRSATTQVMPRNTNYLEEKGTTNKNPFSDRNSVPIKQQQNAHSQLKTIKTSNFNGGNNHIGQQTQSHSRFSAYLHKIKEEQEERDQQFPHSHNNPADSNSSQQKEIKNVSHPEQDSNRKAEIEKQKEVHLEKQTKINEQKAVESVESSNKGEQQQGVYINGKKHKLSFNEQQQQFDDIWQKNRMSMSSGSFSLSRGRANSLSLSQSISVFNNQEQRFSLEYEDLHELNKFDLQIPILEKLRENYENSEDQIYFVPNAAATVPSSLNAESQQEQLNSIGQASLDQSAQVPQIQPAENHHHHRSIFQFLSIFKSKKSNNNNNNSNNNSAIQPTSGKKGNNNNNKVTPTGFVIESDYPNQQSRVNSQLMNIDFDKSQSFDKTVNLFPKVPRIDQLSLDKDYEPIRQKGSCICQMLRSSSSWSLGLEKKNHEMSIQLAYIDLITSSSRFIYIENQFFISCSAGPKVKNLIAQALIDRIKRAADKNETFKVIVVMPLLPGFEGEVNDSGSAVMKCQLHWEYSTISRGGTSILEELRNHPSIEDPSKYIQFFGLRQHGFLNEKPVTEIIYVHSKLMIVDDNYVVMGSANINDRSMLGTRDSEIAMIVEDQEKVSKLQEDKIKKVGKFSHDLRVNLYKEHFGLTSKQAQDPLNEETNNLITSRAKQNTLIYRQVFACYPDDNIEQISQLEGFQKQKDPELYWKYKENIIGNAVELPLNFLCKENLGFSISQKEYFVPDENFT